MIKLTKFLMECKEHLSTSRDFNANYKNYLSTKLPMLMDNVSRLIAIVERQSEGLEDIANNNYAYQKSHGASLFAKQIQSDVTKIAEPIVDSIEGLDL